MTFSKLGNHFETVKNKFISISVCMAVLLLGGLAQGHENHYASAQTDILTITGKLHFIQSSLGNGKRVSREFYVTDEDSGIQYQLHFPSAAPKDLHPGSRVRVKGHKMTESTSLFVALSDGTNITMISAPIVAQISGSRATLVLLLEGNDAGNLCNGPQVEDFLFNNPSQSVAGAFSQSSKNAFTISGKAYEHVRINANVVGRCDDYNWSLMANTAAQQMGISTSSYQSIVYVLPSGTSCPYAGSAAMPGVQTWIRGDYCNRAVTYLHELGHNIGMDHASQNGVEYGDWSDPMGNSFGPLKTVNAPHAVQMGWVPSTKILNGAIGTYTVAALDTDPATTNLPLVIKIPKPNTNDFYYLSYRNPVGYTANMDAGYLNRLTIHRYAGTYLTYLLGLVDVNGSYVDAANGLTITALSSDSQSVTFSVAGTCIPNSPVLTLTPAVVGAAAGQAANYSLSIQNRDSTYCPASNFNLSAAIPAGFTASFSNNLLNITAGGTASTGFTLASSINSLDGIYGFTISSSDVQQAMHNGAVNGQYVLDKTAPSIPQNLVGVVRRGKLTLSWSPSTDNVGVKFYEVIRTDAAGAVVIKPVQGTSTTYSLSKGTFTYKVRAVDEAGNRSVESNTETVSK